MKIKASVQIEISEGPADAFVVTNLKAVGFVEEPGAAGVLRLTFEGNLSENDLAYGASMMRSLKGKS